MGVDAFIMLLEVDLSNKRDFLKMDHLSTQANVLNYLDAKMYKDMGVSRIVSD